MNNATRAALAFAIMGISPSELRWEIGRRLDKTFVDPHNAFAHVAAGSGLICFAALMAVGWTLFFWHPRGGRKITSKEDPLYSARLLMRMLIILWVVRGSFSREILYNLESNEVGRDGMPRLAKQHSGMIPEAQLNLFGGIRGPAEAVAEEIDKLDPDDMTPLQALQLLTKLRKNLKQ